MMNQGDFARKNIIRYVNRICRKMDVPASERKEFCEEITSNLLSSVEELMIEGHSEQEAVKIATEQFGELHNIETELKQVYKFKRGFARGVLRSAMVCLMLGIVFLGGIIAVWDDWLSETYPQDLFNFVNKEMFNPVYYGELPKGMSFEEAKRQRIFDELEKKVDRTWGVDGVRVVINEQGEAKNFTYAENDLARNLLNSKDLLGDDQNPWLWTSVRMQNPFTLDKDSLDNYEVYVTVKYFKYDLFFVSGIMLLIGFWLLFAVWATINVYAQGNGHLAWIVVFIMFNVLGYFIYRTYRNRRPLVAA